MIFPGTPGRFSDHDHAMKSNVGKGPKGDGIIADVVENDPYGVYRVQFKNSRTGEVYLITPNMDPGSRIYFCNLTLQYQSSEDVDVSYTVPLSAFSSQQVGTIRDARVGDMVFYKLRREGMLGANAIGIGIITNLSLDDNVTFMQHSVLDIENIDEIDAQVRRLQEDADNIENALDAVQSTLDDLPSYDEFLSLSEDVRQNESDITTKIPWPVTPYSKYGIDGQVLRTNADGSTQWQNPVIPTDAQAETYINAWLNAHPEATTTIQDGSITTAKLADGAVTDVKLAQSSITTAKLADGAVTDVKLAQSSGVLEAVFDESNAVNTQVFVSDNVGLTPAYSGCAIGISGYVRTNGFYNVSQFVDVREKLGIVVNYQLSFTVDADAYCGIAFFALASFGNPIKTIPNIVEGRLYGIPNEANYVLLTYNVSSSSPSISLLSGAIEQIEDDVSNVSNIISDVIEQKPKHEQLYDNSNPFIFNGYCNGVNFFSSSSHKMLYIPCKPNTYYTVSADNSMWKTVGVYGSEDVPANGASASAFSVGSDAVTVVENGRKYITALTKPDANYICVAYYNSGVTQQASEEQVRETIMIAEGVERTEYKNYIIEIKIKESVLPELGDKRYYHTIVGKAALLTTGQKIEFASPNIKKNNIISFHGIVNTHGSLTIGQGRNAINQTAYITINATTVKVYRYTTQPVEWITLNHGLTIKDYIDVTIIVSNDEIGWAKLIVTSNGDSYEYSRMAWLGCGNAVYAEVEAGSYSSCVLTHSSSDYDKKLWACGDSYFDHWVTHALADGFKNFLCDGWSGRKSSQALTSLNILLNHGCPNSILWCMGMNDGDSSSAVNNGWKSSFDSFIALCNEKDIKPILCTIPNTPTINNSFKNEIIRSSGYDYIDMAKAVGSEITTSWYDRLLSSDNVHPSQLGDVMIAKYIEAVLPQTYGD